jgi:hypothetical protein
MAKQFQKRFTDGQGRVFGVTEVIQTPVGLTVYYYNEKTGQEYSCLLEAFSQRFQELVND